MANVQIAVVEDQSTRIDVVLAIPGIQGVVGPGVAAGGSIGEVLVKDSLNNYETAWSDSLDLAGTLDVAGAVTIGGDLTVNGATTTVDTVNLVVKDKNIELASVPIPTDASADGGGITLKGTTDKTLNWADATDSWTSSEHVNLANGKTYKINGTDVLSATALGSSVQISSSNIPDGTVTNNDLAGSIANNKLANSTITVNSASTALGGSVTLYAGTTTLRTSSANQGLTGVSSIALPGATSGTITVTPAATAGTTAITIPATTGTLITSGDTGTVTSAMLADGTVVDADINANAEIAVSKLADGAARQLLQTDVAGTGVEWTSNVDIPGTLDVTSTATFDATAIHPAGSATAASVQVGTGTTYKPGLYSPGADQLAISTGGTGRIHVTSNGTVNIVGAGSAGSTQAVSFNGSAPVNSLVVDSSGKVGINTSAPANYFELYGDGLRIAQRANSTAGESVLEAQVSNYWSAPTYVGTALVQNGSAAAGTKAGITAANLGELRFQNASGGLIYCNGPSPLIFATTDIERLRITSTGTVNIVGAGTPGSTQAISFNGSAPANSLVVASDGKVGMGLGAAQTLLHLRSDSNSAVTHLYLMNRTSGASVESRIAFTTSANDLSDNRHAYIGAVTTGAGENGNSIVIATNPNGSATIERLRVSSTGTVTIGSTGASNASTLYVSRNPTGATSQYGIYSDGTIQSDVTANNSYYTTSARTAAASFTLANLQHFLATQSTIGAGSTVTNQYGFYAESNLTGATNNYGFYSNIASGANRWNFYAAGSANNYFAGSVLVGGAVQAKNFTINATDIASNIANGMFAPAGNELGFVTNATERGRFDSSGRLLLGTSTARSNFFNSTNTSYLQVEGTGEASAVRNVNDTYGAMLLLGKSRSTGNTIVQNGDTAGLLTFQGNDGSEFVECATIKGQIDGTPGANSMPGRIVLSTTASGAGSPTERMRIGQNGFIFIQTTATYPGGGNTNTGAMFEAAGDGTSLFVSRANGIATTFNRNSDGSILNCHRSGATVGSITVTTTATAYNTSSDYRLKENVTPVTDGITRLQQLKPSRFNFIADPDKTVDGFIAHEVQAIIPEAVTGEKDAVDDDGNPQYQGIDQSKLVPLLTAALQEAITRIETLEAKVAALESV